MVTIKHLMEATALVLLFCALRLLPLDTASRFGGWLARNIGPMLKAHKTAVKNLIMAFPGLPEEEYRRILRGMWDNLGRVAAELPRLPDNALHERLTLRGAEHLPPSDTPVLFISAHLGNWELTYPVLHRRGIRLAMVYRRANNPFVDGIITRLRATQCTNLFPKGPAGAVGLVRALKDKMSLAMLVDQKMNDGIAVPFFGHEAMTAPAVAQFALKYDLPIIPAYVVRKEGAYFEGVICPPLAFERTGDEKRDILAIMTAINRLLESWIRAHPEQWFWVHKRWPDS